MPVVHFHLAEDTYTDEQCELLMEKASELYSEVLESPMERVRAFINFYPEWGMATAGSPVSRGGRTAPYFDFIVLEGRPLDQCHALLEGFTSLLVSILGADRELVRGSCRPVPPHYWGIAGKPASEVRAKEIENRGKIGADQRK